MCLCGQVPDLSRIDSMLNYLNDGKSPGCFVGVIKDGKVVYAKGFGYADVEKKIPINSETNFNVASNSKQFTAASILLLQESGKLKYTDDVRKYIPELPDHGTVITINHLLHHISGIRDWTELHRLLCLPPSRERLYPLKLITEQQKLNFIPGSRVLYCNSNYYLLGLIVERVSGEPLHDFIRKNIFNACGMKHSTFSNDSLVYLPARGYSKQDTGWTPDELKFVPRFGEGGLITSFEDLNRWFGFFNDSSANKRSSFREMETVGILNNGKKTSVGKGLFVYNWQGKKVIVHGGNTDGFSSQWVSIPDENLYVVCLSNCAEFPYNKYCFLIENLFSDYDSFTSYAQRYTEDFNVADSLCGFYLDSLNMEFSWVESKIRNAKCDAQHYDSGCVTYSLTREWNQATTKVFQQLGDAGMKLTVSGVGYVETSHRIKEEPLSKECCGKYYCPELENLRFDLKIKNGKYYFLVDKKYTADVIATFGDMCTIQLFGSLVRFKSSGGKVTSFELSSGRVKRLEFLRVP